MNQFAKEQLLIQFPNAPEKEIKQAIKYQEKFSLTLDNLKCMNPDCNNIRKWLTTKYGFSSLCSGVQCIDAFKNDIKKRRVQKHKENYLAKTGYEHPGQNPKIKQKKKETCLAKYGVNNPFESKDIQKIIKGNYLAKTGYTHQALNPEVQQKKKETCLAKYGVSNTKQKHIINFKEWNNKQFWLENFITVENIFDYIKCITYFNCTSVTSYTQIKKLGIEYTKIRCTSIKEQALYPFLDGLGFVYETNVRNVIDNLELDIFFPELDLAIEYNGLYWHSYHESIGTSPKQLDLNYMKYRHQAKSLACISKGIRLLHIYEDTENIENLILDFLNYEACNQEGSLKEPNSYELDSGCYPLGLEYEAIEPESRIVLGDRLLFNAGKIHTN